MYFNLEKSHDGIIYSLDGIRLKVDFGKNMQEMANLISHLQAYDLRYQIDYYHKFSPFGYVHQWTFHDTLDNEVSWTLLACYGNPKDCTGVMDFNPNKCENSPLFKEFFDIVRKNTYTRDIVRYDLAIDIPIQRSEAYLVRNGKQAYQYFIKDDGITEYLGTRSHNGFVKLYDKTKESGLDYPLTRLEITIDKGVSALSVFPTVHIREPQLSLTMSQELTQNDLVLVELLRAVPDPQRYLAKLGWRKRKKIEPYLADKVLSLDETSARKIYEQALNYE